MLMKLNKIFLPDYSTRRVKELTLNKKILGPDLKPKLVKSITKSKQDVYEIKPKYSSAFYLSKKHIILYKIGDKQYEDTVENLLKLKNLKNMTLVSTTKHYKYIPTTFDPYTYGKLVGNNVRNGIKIVEKHVKEYIENDEKTRLDFLAGLLEETGKVEKGKYLSFAVNGNLYTEFLLNFVQGLGFHAQKFRKINGLNQWVYHCSIDGKLSSIPIRNTTVLSTLPDSPIDYANQTFSIKKYKDNISYYSFTTEGDNSYILSNYIIIKNNIA